jgi:hypothetical protein
MSDNVAGAALGKSSGLPRLIDRTEDARDKIPNRRYQTEDTKQKIIDQKEIW